MRRNHQTKSGNQSLDGVMPASRSYQPGSKRPLLGDFNASVDGFFSQRGGNELGVVADEPQDAMLGNELMSTASHERQLPNSSSDIKSAKKRRLPRLMFWRRKKQADKKQLSRKQKSLRFGLRFALLVALIIGGYFGYKFWQTSHNVLHGGGSSAALSECKNINQLKREGDCRINILLLGRGGPGHDGPDLTDTIMLASIDPINHSVALLSIPRDLWVQIPGYGSSKINAAYAWGKQYSTAKSSTGKERDGLKLLDSTLDPVIGMTINYHVVVDFKAFQDAVNDLGGVDINVTPSELNYPYGSTNPTQLYDPTIAWENNNNPVIAKKGEQTMNGQQALLFARSRETSSDFARSQRQRAVLVAIANKILSVGTFSNPVKVSKLLTSFGSNVYTDLSLGSISPLYSLASKVPSYDITSLDLATSPGNLVTTGNIGGASVVLPTAGEFNYSQILPYVRASLRDGYLAKENAAVEVYNATSLPGIATQEMTLLRSYGYNAVGAASAPDVSDQQQTILVDLSHGSDPYTRHYLENRFKTVSVSSLPSQFGIKPKPGTNFVIILGQDASTTSSNSTTAG